MSHFTAIRTRMVERDLLCKSLTDLDLAYQEGRLTIRGMLFIERTRVEIRVAAGKLKNRVGFRKRNGVYEMVADWWGLRRFDRSQFLRQITQRYAYNAARAKLEKQGFDLVEEETQKNGQIHMVLRRMA
jgi:hypothetical protein